MYVSFTSFNNNMYGASLTYKGEDNCEEGSCRKCNCHIQIQHLKQVHWKCKNVEWNLNQKSHYLSKQPPLHRVSVTWISNVLHVRVLLNGYWPHFPPQPDTYLWRQRFDDDNTSTALKSKLSENKAKWCNSSARKKKKITSY